jgi:hypothetical protein
MKRLIDVAEKGNGEEEHPKALVVKKSNGSRHQRHFDAVSSYPTLGPMVSLKYIYGGRLSMSPLIHCIRAKASALHATEPPLPPPPPPLKLKVEPPPQGP